MATQTEKRRRLLNLDLKFMGSMPTAHTELQEAARLCEELGFERARAHYASIVASVEETPKQWLPMFTISVLLYLAPDEEPDIILVQSAHGQVEHDDLVRELTRRWADWPDIKIVGLRGVVYKDLEEALMPAREKA